MTARVLTAAPSLNEGVDTMLFKRILFVENDPQIAGEVRDTLDLHFYDVTVVPNGPLAVRTLMKDSYDAVLCDSTMPCFPAEMFYQAVERIRPELCKRFISITNSAASKNARSIGALSIWKPIDMQILLEAIETVLRKNQPVTGKILDPFAYEAA